MLNPIEAAEKIKEDYVGYVTTRRRFADREYSKKFRDALLSEGAMAKGPYLSLSDSFEKGASINDLIFEGVASPLFRDLESGVPEDKDREIPLERTLWAHQENAMRKALAGKNLVVTTGTGSGKTECFILPILNYLLSEQERGTLGSGGVRAILVYPMNALVNDQMKRLRDILRDYPSIRFGVYNGNTKEKYEDGINEYGKIHRDPETKAPLKPIGNEVVSRDVMRDNPPHILVTNYAMLEYMLLRPKDDAVFRDAELKFLVLDETHTYKGATGIETSLLLRRLKVRIGCGEEVVHILTSATLGGEDADDEIVRFAETLCDAPFSPEGIIRSKEAPAEMPEQPADYPVELFGEMASPTKPLDAILKEYGVPTEEGSSDEEIIFDVCLRSAAYRALRECATEPMSINELAGKISERMDMSEEDIVNLITVASQGFRGKTPLIKARYHMFIKALEGAYSTLTKDKPLSLERRLTFETPEGEAKAFELCVCDDCGRHGIAGKEIGGVFEFASGEWDEKLAVYVPTNQDETWSSFEAEDGFDDEIDGSDYLICPVCGEIHHESNRSEFSCGHDADGYVRLRSAVRIGENGGFRCPSCGQGTMGLFTIGYDAATSVLGTSLFELLPESEAKLASRPTSTSAGSNPFSLGSASPRVDIVRKARQFIAFSDSRAEAAYYGARLGSEYQEFLRRRGLWHVLKKHGDAMSANPWELEALVDKLTAYFDENRTFAEYDDEGGRSLTEVSQRQAWVAVLNEMVSSKRPTSLTSLGAIDFIYKGNLAAPWEAIAENLNYPADVLRALFDQLIRDMLREGIIDAKGCGLLDTDREYIFYSVAPRTMVRTKTDADKGVAHIRGWLPRERQNGTRHDNNRVVRTRRALGISEQEAIDLLGMYWDGVLAEGPHHLSFCDGEGSLALSSFLVAPRFEGKALRACSKCGQRSISSEKSLCENAKCDGVLEVVDTEGLQVRDHYARLYSEGEMKPLHIKEHTAQLESDDQQKYQELFIEKKLNVLSCSTTFEMGVDVGDLEAIFLRNMPPTPANYVQRAGRAGRSAKTAAFSLTYAKKESHDFTFFKDPRKMISGEIPVPLLTITNEKVVLRHIYAVALSAFFAENDDVYNRNDAHVLLNEDGFERLVSYLERRPVELSEMLDKSISEAIRREVGLDGWNWVPRLVGEDGVLRIAVMDHRSLVDWCTEEINRAVEAGDYQRAGERQRALKNIRRAPEDGVEKGQLKKAELIEFLVRNNILPKYGFPVDVVELHQNAMNPKLNKVQLMRDLQLAVAEYAPGSQVVADGEMYTSRYIRRLPKTSDDGWSVAFIAKCPSESCNTWNHRTVAPGEDGAECVSCRRLIEARSWKEAIEPRMGFVSEPPRVVRKKPQRLYRSDDLYIGDPLRNIIETKLFQIGGKSLLEMETSSNDTLMVLCDDDFFVCRQCGYSIAYSSAKNERGFTYGRRRLPKQHDAPWGRKCGCDSLERKSLCHTFKTDVVRLAFDTPYAKSKDTMLSVMYALLEGASEFLRIERSDIKGCLHKVRLNGSMVFEIVLFDAVAGGAGHVRRIVDDDGSAFRGVVESAISRLSGCSCSPSCYSCLRNYANRMIHDRLNRELALRFLEEWRGEAIPVEPDTVKTCEDSPAPNVAEGGPSAERRGESLEVMGSQCFDGWKDLLAIVPEETVGFFKSLADMRPPAPDFVYPKIVSSVEGSRSRFAICSWSDSRVLLFEPDGKTDVPGWTCVATDEITTVDMLKLLNGVN